MSRRGPQGTGRCLAALPALLVLLPHAAAASETEDDNVAHEIVFQLNQASDLSAVLAAFNLTEIDQVAGVNTFLASAPSGSNEQNVVQNMLLDARVAAAEEAHLAEAPEGRFRTLAIADGGGSLAKVRGQDALKLVGADSGDLDRSGRRRGGA